jgi:pimeloyl-ACP methyl ester carboxylesterase
MLVLVLGLALLMADDGIAALGAEGASVLRVPVAPAETLTVTIEGSGAPVVLIPGLFGSAWGYRNVVPLLTDAGFRTVIIEPLAIGSSSRPLHADYSLTAQAARIAAVLDTLGLLQVIVVGHSAGAVIAYRLALQRPDLVRGIVSLEGGPAEGTVTAGFRHAMSLAPLLRLAGAGFLRGKIHRSLVASSGDSSWVTDDLIRRYTAGATADLSGTLRAFRRMADAREPERLAPRLGQLRCPVHLLLGGAPHQGGPDSAAVARLRDGVPNLVIDSVPGAGLYLQEERPERVAAAITMVAAARP